jgi:hypothetical protein
MSCNGSVSKVIRYEMDSSNSIPGRVNVISLFTTVTYQHSDPQKLLHDGEKVISE